MNHIPAHVRGTVDGCTVCGTQDTATVDGHHGRRCTAHPPTFDPARAVALVVAGQAAQAFSYCRTELS